MLTLATVEIPRQPDGDYTIYVDVDDQSPPWAYIKQGDDWICFPASKTDALIRALQNVWR